MAAGKSKEKKRLKLDNLPDLLTVREVAELLRVSPLTIKRWGKRGKLPAIRINSFLKFTKNSKNALQVIPYLIPD